MPDYQVIQLASLGPRFDGDLQRRFKVFSITEERLPDNLEDLVGQVTIAVTSVRRGLYENLIERLPALKAVCSWGVGHDTLDVDAARRRGIAVSTTPDVLNDCVADLAWALLLAAARRVAEADRYVKGGRWQVLGRFPEATRVSRKRLGILGMGRVGQAIARRGLGFEMEIGYHNRRPLYNAPGVYFSDLTALADWANFLIVACPGGPQTHHLVSETVLRALGVNGLIVNIARGTVIDQNALEDVLLEGALGGAGLDVLDHEPNQPEILGQIDRVVLTPHIGSCTFDTRREMEKLVLGNIETFFAEGRLLTPIFYKKLTINR